jgi:glycosyltransferase involved in cell wall biosynthesis
MKALDTFVLCSRHEGFGRVAVEAMALAVPVVASDGGALRELVREGAGRRLAAPGDWGAFASALVDISRDHAGPALAPEAPLVLNPITVAAALCASYSALRPGR